MHGGYAWRLDRMEIRFCRLIMPYPRSSFKVALQVAAR
jgi:hypothetical protein